MPDVLDGVVLVDVEVAVGLELRDRSRRAWRTAPACGRGSGCRSRSRSGRVPSMLEVAADLRLFRVALDGGGSHREHGLQFVDVVEHGDGAFGLEAGARVRRAAGCAGAAMPMNGTPAARAQRASSTVSPTYQTLAAGVQLRGSASRPSGAGLGCSHVSAGRRSGRSASCGAKRAQRELGLVSRAAGEDARAGSARARRSSMPGRAIQRSRRIRPSAPLPRKSSLKWSHDCRRTGPRRRASRDDAGARAPNRRSSRPGSCSPGSARALIALAGEVLDGLADGLAVGSVTSTSTPSMSKTMNAVRSLPDLLQFARGSAASARACRRSRGRSRRFRSCGRAPGRPVRAGGRGLRWRACPMRISTKLAWLGK